MYVTFEAFPVDLIQDIAASVYFTTGQIGLLVSGYVVVAAAVTIPTAALASRVSRKTALVASLLLLVVAEVRTATSTTAALLTYLVWVVASCGHAHGQRRIGGGSPPATFGCRASGQSPPLGCGSEWDVRMRSHPGLSGIFPGQP